MMTLLVTGTGENRQRLYDILDGILSRNAPIAIVTAYNPKTGLGAPAEKLAYQWATDRRVGMSAGWRAPYSHALVFGEGEAEGAKIRRVAATV